MVAGAEWRWAMTPERLATLKAMCERGRAKWRETHGDHPCNVLDVNAELIAEVEKLTPPFIEAGRIARDAARMAEAAHRDANAAALLVGRMQANHKAEIDALTKDRDAWKAALVTERIKASVREVYPNGVGRAAGQ